MAAVADWVVELSRADRDTAARADESYERLLEKPLRRFGAVLPEDSDLVERTLELVRPLREGHVPPVFEHGDLSHPNLIRLADGRVGVVDWELAEPRGLPAHDLCFFLAYAAFARGPAGTTDQQLRAFDEAFFGPDAWARPLLEGYADRTGGELRGQAGQGRPVLRPRALEHSSGVPSGRAWLGGISPRSRSSAGEGSRTRRPERARRPTPCRARRARHPAAAPVRSAWSGPNESSVTRSSFTHLSPPSS